MKKLLLILILMIPVLSFAQNSGTIIYDQTIQLDIDLPEGMDEAMKAMIPSSQTSKLALYFNEQESVYKNYEESEESTESSSDDGSTTVKMIIMQPENITYCNRETKALIEKKDFMGKHFLIKDEFVAPLWKLTGQQKQVGKYICQEATYQEDSTRVVAYFTSQIPIAVGPSTYQGLPGAVLEVNINDGRTVIVATKVQVGTVPSDMIVEPTKGKKVTNEEYLEIVEEKMKEMNFDSDGGTKVEIRMH